MPLSDQSNKKVRPRVSSGMDSGLYVRAAERLLGKEASRMIVLEKTLVAVMPQANECRSQICEFPILFDSTRWKRKKPLRIVRLEFGPSMMEEKEAMPDSKAGT